MSGRIFRTVTASLMVAGLMLGSAPQRARAEDNAAEIPGVPWVGRAVTGLIGAETVDKVWRLELPEGRVGIFRVTGEAGAELGLYLFDSSATSVLTATPLKTSAKAGSSQRFVSLLPAGTYYVNVNGRNVDRKYAFSLSISLIEDPTPPFISIVTASGKTRVSSTEVRMKVFASDGLSGVEALRWRVDGASWSDWAAYTSSLVTVSLPETEGSHLIEMQAKNGAELVSEAAEFSVTLDLTPPVSTLLLPKETTVVSSARPLIKYQFNEPMSGAAWRRGGLLVYEFEAGTVLGTHEYDPITRTGTFRPDAPLTPGGTYVVEFSEAADTAGNAPTGGAWSFTYLAKTSLNATIRSLSVAGGDGVRIPFRAKGVPAGSPIYLEELVDLGGGVFRWTLLRETTARGDGELQSLRFTPERSGRYALRFPGSDSHQSSRTASIPLTLTPTVGIVGRTEIRSVTAGSEASATFRVLPANLDQVSLVKYRCNSDFTTCTVAETLPAIPDAEGLVRTFWTAESSNWAWRVRVTGDSGNEAARSRLLRFAVR
jgi:hypothetical protein